MTKLYNIVNGFIDVHNDKEYSIEQEPVPFTEERVKEIETAEKLIGYKLIEEVKASKEKEIDNKKIK